VYNLLAFGTELPLEIELSLICPMIDRDINNIIILTLNAILAYRFLSIFVHIKLLYYVKSLYYLISVISLIYII